MTTPDTSTRPRIFVSHASADLVVAQQIEAVLEASGYDPWLDHSDIQLGVLLRKELAQAIEASRAVVLVWSRAAAASRWVASEVLRSFHTDRFVVPCVLDEAALPQFLSRSVHLDLRTEREAALNQLAEKLEKAPQRHNEFPALSSYREPELQEAIESIHAQQAAALDCLGRHDLAGARQRHEQLDPEMRAAEKRWRYDPTMLNLSGYHRKNAYMLGHWDEYCAGRFPADPILHEGERRFFDTLFVNPIDCSALNGLGNILLFEGELDAAEFFVQRAIACARQQGWTYTDAEHDLKVIRGRRQAPELGRAQDPG